MLILYTLNIFCSFENRKSFNHHIVENMFILHFTIFYFFLFFAELNKNPVEGFSAGLIDESDIHKWEVLIIGPPDTL